MDVLYVLYGPTIENVEYRNGNEPRNLSIILKTLYQCMKIKRAKWTDRVWNSKVF